MSLSTTIALKDLRRVVDNFSGITRNPSIPLNGYALLVATPGVGQPRRVTFSASDFEAEITISLDSIKTDGGGAVMLPVKTLKGIVAAMLGNVTIKKEKRDVREFSRERRQYQVVKRGVIVFSDGTSTITINDIMPTDNYANMHSFVDIKAGASVAMSPDDILRFIRLSRHCMNREETRYYLNGMYFARAPGSETLRAAATDGHRLAVIDSAITVPSEFSGIVPDSTVDFLSRVIVPGGNAPVKLTIVGKLMQIKTDDVKITTKLIDGTFPDITRVIPPPSENIRFELGLAPLKRVAAFARATDLGEWAGLANNRLLKFDLPGGIMSIDNDDGSNITQPVQGVHAAPARLFGYNWKFLLDQARITPTFQVTAKSGSYPAILRGEDVNAFWVVMPMHVDYGRF